jgi:soluble lytic murein transglycosylase-like protein
MIKHVLVRVAVVAVSLFALAGLGALASVLSGDLEFASPEQVLAPVDTAAALVVAQDQLAETQGELDRAHRILEFSGRYRIPADLASRIYDHATDAGIPPALGFQLVKIESRFINSATSYASAIGLTQLRLPTARSYEPTVTPADLMNPDVNLRIGFAYLKDLLRQFHGDLSLALEAYNKGPTLVTAQMQEGIQVRGKYSNAVLGGMRKGL